MSRYPQMFRVRQKFEGPRVEDIPGTVQAELTRLKLQSASSPGRPWP